MADKLKLDRNDMKNRETSHLRIYVGGLTDQVTVDDLYNHFSTYGQINGIVVNRNFGFVQFEKETSAQDAIAKADGTSLLNRKINVKTAQTNTDKQRRDTEVVVVEPEIPAAVALNDNIPLVLDEESEDVYDSYGNYIGDQNSRDEDYDDRYNQGNQDIRGRSRVRRRPNRGGRGRGGPPDNFQGRPSVPGREPGNWSDRGNYDRYPPQQMPDYPRPIPVSEKNDCEIIVVSKVLTEYAEYIEGRLKRLGIVVDLLFPMEDVPIGKVLGNIASRGCLYAILVMPQNQEHRSLTLTILHGLPQEHRNMPLEDALQLMSRNFQEVQRGGTSGREAVYALLGQLADGRSLTVVQYDKVIEYLQERKEHQIKLELGEPLATQAPANKTQAQLQQRILTILNDKKVAPANDPPAPVPPPAQQPDKTKLFSDPSVRKALDSILMKFT